MQLKERIEIILNKLQEKRGSKKQFLNEESCKRNYLDVYNQIKQYQLDNNVIFSKFAELVYLITHEKGHCKWCHETTKFKLYDSGYMEYCGTKCRYSDPEFVKRAVENTKNGTLKNHGVENISQLASIKKRKEDTMFANYGVKYNSQRKEVKKIISNMMQTPEHIKKIKKGLIDSIGVSNPSLSKTVIDKRQKTFESNRNIRLSEMSEYIKYNFIKYNNEFDIELKCHKGHLFNINYQLFQLRFHREEEVCTICNKIHKPISKQEINLRYYIESIYKDCILLNNKLLDGKEIDIYLPKEKIGFEYNGTYYHSEATGTPNDYHFNKTEISESKGIRLIHIYEDDWNYKKEIVKSRIKNLLKGNDTKIYARKTDIRLVDKTESQKFLLENHIQGSSISQVNLGLYYNNELISLMTFGYRKISGSNSLELHRFCNKLNTSVIGGASKLFSYFINNYQFEELLSYADRSWSIGELYNTLGFELVGKTKPNYWWVINGIKKHRLNFTKTQLIKKELLLEGETEVQCMWRLKYHRIYDSGSLIYKFKQKDKMCI